MKRINKVKIDVTNMNQAQEAKAIKASELMLVFFKSDFFKNKIYSTDFSKLLGASKNCISRKLNFDKDKIYNLFMTGEEEWNGVKDYEIDLKISTYYTWKGVVGYIIPMKPTIWVNTKFFNNYSPRKVGNNGSHEWSHTLGFRHYGRWLRESLPYLINAWWDEFWNGDFSEIETPKPISTEKYETVCKRVWWKLWLGKACYKVVTI